MPLLDRAVCHIQFSFSSNQRFQPTPIKMKLEIGTTFLLLASTRTAFAADYLLSEYDHRILQLSQQCLADDEIVDANPVIVDLFASVSSEYLTDHCSGGSTGVICEEYIPTTSLVELEGACEGVGGQYIGLRDYKLECESTSPVCENLGAICIAFAGDPLSCWIVPGCAYNTGSGSCFGSDTDCGSRSYVITSQEKPNCIGKTSK